jgi:oxygen-independent coproporphyrinogen-3 oxidase
VASFSRTLEQVITYQPDRLAIFSYAHVPWVAPAQRILERASLPDPETKLAMLEAVIGQLTAAGYRYIGMDHFARAGDELVSALDNGTLHRNFQGYSTRAGRELCGFGMSAISQSGNAYRQNHKELNAWHAALAAGRLPIERGYLLSDDDRIRRQVIAGIMCAGRFSFAATSAASGIDARAYFAREWANLDDFAADGLIERDPDGFTLTPLGRLLMRNVAMRFDAHLAELENRHAKTI